MSKYCIKGGVEVKKGKLQTALQEEGEMWQNVRNERYSDELFKD